jgi:hypothetical protein
LGHCQHSSVASFGTAGFDGAGFDAVFLADGGEEGGATPSKYHASS